MFFFRKGHGGLFSNRKIKDPKYRFLFHSFLSFWGFFSVGVLFSQMSDMSFFQGLGVIFPSDFSFLSPDVPLPFFRDFLKKSAVVALMISLPILSLFLLGLRSDNYFCLSRFWILLFCAIHGCIFHRFCQIFIDFWAKIPYGYFVRLLYICSMPLLIVMIVFAHIQLFDANRLGVVGVLLPCLRRQKIVIHQQDDKDGLSARMKRYCRSFFELFVKTYIAELSIMLLLFGFRKLMQI